MEIKLWGIPARFTFGFFLMTAISALADKAGIALYALAAIAVHESGHLIMMRLTGAQVTAMTFSPFGVRLEKRGMLSYNQETAVYFGGVAANGAALSICAGLLLWAHESGEAASAAFMTKLMYGGAPENFMESTLLFAAVNLFLIVFNLLPIGRLDGGVLLCMAFSRAGWPQQAKTLQKAVGLLLLLPLFCVSLWMLPKGNFVLLFTAFYLTLTLLADTQ